MNLLENTAKLLEMNPNPAFLVKEGKVVYANSTALQRFINIGCDVAPLLITGADEYEAFRGDCLCLRLKIEQCVYDAFVQVYDQMHLFVLETPSNSPELRAMALVAQELRQPLSGMLNLTDELLPAILANAPQTTQQLAVLNKNLHQLLRIVGNMSDAYHFSNISEPIVETKNICAFSSELFEKVKTLLDQTNIPFQYDVAVDELFAPINAEILSRGIYNLFSNAIKFTPANGQISAKVTCDRNKLCFSIRNTGSMPDQIRNNAFQRFSRQPGIEDGRFGIGLGMEIARAAAALHGGTILVHQHEDTITTTLTVLLRRDMPCKVRENILQIDADGGMDVALIQLSDALPSQMYTPE